MADSHRGEILGPIIEPIELYRSAFQMVREALAQYAPPAVSDNSPFAIVEEAEAMARQIRELGERARRASI